MKNSLPTFGYKTNKMKKTIKITEETHKRLLRLGNKSETFDALFVRLLDSHKYCGLFHIKKTKVKKNEKKKKYR